MNTRIQCLTQKCIPVGCVPPAHWPAISHRWGACIPHMPPLSPHTPPSLHAPCHTCPSFAMHFPICHTCPSFAMHPPLPCMHAPLSPCMSPWPCTPLAMHAPHQPCMPPWPWTPPAMHAPCHTCPPAMQAPLPCTPKWPCTSPCHAHMPLCHAHPQPCTPSGHTCPPCEQNDNKCKNITLPQTSFAGGN